MELVKLNVLHWHLTDSESAPLELPSLPEAAERGAFCAAMTYSAADVRRVVEYAGLRGIRVVPEFDTPGHSGGFFLSRPHLFCGTDWASAVLDPTNAGVPDFLAALYSDARALFPDDVLHLGGDEVSVDCWNASSSVRAWLRRHPNETVSSLFGYYEHLAHAAARRAGAPQTMAWDEVLADPRARSALSTRASIVHAWNGPGGSPVTSDPNLLDAVANGFRAVTSHGYYLTAGDGVDARLVVRWEDIYDRDLAAPVARNDSSLLNLVLGGEAALWGTKIDDRVLDAVAWPRAAVFAERLWAPNDAFSPGNYTDILPRLIVMTCRLARAGLRPTPVDEGTAKFDRRSPWQQCL